ncbi:MAG: hypothetical protein ACKO4A_17220 [Gammaproteobacteria bacterium]
MGKGLDVAREVQDQGAEIDLLQFRRRADVETLRQRDRRERQRPLRVALCPAMAVAAFTGVGLLREIQATGTTATFGRGPGPKH